MKHLTRDDISAGDAEIAELGLSIERDALSLIWSYLDAVLEENTLVNLTAVSVPHEAARMHVVDSLSALPEVEAAPYGSLVDIGSGGGFPGVPLALAAGRQATLLDSVGRKGQAVGRALKAAGAPESLITVTMRAEELAHEAPGAFAVALARAVAPLPSLVELASPLLQMGGRFVAMKGVLPEEELAAGDLVAQRTGMRRLEKRMFTLPFGEEARTLVVYERLGDPDVILPRRVGMAQKRPLA